MNAAAILDRLRDAGVHVRLDPADPERLRLSPPDRLTPDLLGMVRERKADLLAALRRPTLPTPEQVGNWGEYLLERAAIREYDGGQTRTEAERAAWLELVSRYPESAAFFMPWGAA